jgi:hypothetical protein
MADNVNIPQNLTKVIEVKDTSDPLRKFLLSLLVKITTLEKQVAELQEKTKGL